MKREHFAAGAFLGCYRRDWRGTKWATFEARWLRRIPSLPGCYVIMIDGAAVYVGQSIDVQARLISHGLSSTRTPWGSGRVTVKVRYESRLGDRAMREMRLIHRLKPRGNRQSLGRRVAA